MPHATPPLGITAPSTTTGARTVHAITVFFDTADHFSLKLVELDGDEKRPLCPTQGKNKQEQTKDGRRQRERERETTGRESTGGQNSWKSWKTTARTIRGGGQNLEHHYHRSGEWRGGQSLVHVYNRCRRRKLN